MNTLKPFKRFCITLGEIPSSYLESMSYYETLVWLCNYLNKTIEPSLKETQEAVTELQEFVSHYFDNLDVQEEINTKLDEMAESGELTEIIAQYLELAGLLCFNTKNDMKGAENLSNGSFVKTFGTSTYNDGYGEFYKIRTLTSGDTIDNVNIIALTHYPTLIAELIHNKTLDDIVTEVATYTSRISSLESNNLTELVVVGDSYTHYDESVWAETLASQLHLNLHKIGRGGIGFQFNTNHPTENFLTYLNAYTITESERLHTKYFICYGGVNDLGKDSTTETTNVIAFFTRAKELYPNANFIMVGPQAFWQNRNNAGYNGLIEAIKKGAYESKVTYINPYSWLWGDGYAHTDTYLTDNNHPTDLGHKIIASKMMGAINSLHENFWIKISKVEAYASNTSVRTYSEENHVHIEGRINGQTWATGQRIRILDFDSNYIDMLNTGYFIGDVYKFNDTYTYSPGKLGTLTLGSGGNGLLLYNDTGSSYTGDIIFKCDIYKNGINI